MYRLIEFDIDGTLVDTERTYVLSLMDAVKAATGKPIPEDDARAVFGLASHLVPGRFGIEGEQAVRFSKDWMIKYRALTNLIVAFPGARELVRKVKQAGFMTAIVTSRNDEEISYDKVTAPFLEDIDIIVSASKTNRHKPDPEPAAYGIARACELAGERIDPSEVLYLGDTMADWGCGAGAGADFALADWRNRGLQDIPADYHFHNADEALDIILGKTPKIR